MIQKGGHELRSVRFDLDLSQGNSITVSVRIEDGDGDPGQGVVVTDTGTFRAERRGPLVLVRRIPRANA